MWIVRLALNRPYTFVVVAILILLLSPAVILRTPTDIFPNIYIPVISVAWSWQSSNNDEGVDPRLEIHDDQHVDEYTGMLRGQAVLWALYLVTCPGRVDRQRPYIPRDSSAPWLTRRALFRQMELLIDAPVPFS